MPGFALLDDPAAKDGNVPEANHEEHAFADTVEYWPPAGGIEPDERPLAEKQKLDGHSRHDVEPVESWKKTMLQLVQLSDPESEL